MNTPAVGAVVLGSAVAAYVGGLRARQLRWGATAREVAAIFPGDDRIAAPDLMATRAITIDASAVRVWPWIAQLGQGRGGFYSYDGLENLIGADIHSADRIVAEWQDIRVGDAVQLAEAVGMTVIVAEPGRALVIRRAVPMGSVPCPYDCTSAWLLRERPDGTTRLVVRERYAYLQPWAPLILEPVAVVSFLMTQKMLRGIKARAESLTTPDGRSPGAEVAA